MQERTSATLSGSFQYKLLSFRTNAPGSFLLFTRTITSPGAWSGLSSASPSNVTSEPSGIPRSILQKVSCQSKAEFYTERWYALKREVGR